MNPHWYTLPRALRLRMLKSDVERDRWGVALLLPDKRAMPSSLDRLAESVEVGRSLTREERSVIAALLRAVADGVDVRKDLRIAPRRAARGRPVKPLRWLLAREVYARVDEGDTIGAAISGVAADAGLPADTVRKSIETYGPEDEPPKI